jgi:hypothetical protein
LYKPVWIEVVGRPRKVFVHAVEAEVEKMLSFLCRTPPLALLNPADRRDRERPLPALAVHPAAARDPRPNAAKWAGFRDGNPSPARLANYLPRLGVTQPGATQLGGITGTAILTNVSVPTPITGVMQLDNSSIAVEGRTP